MMHGDLVKAALVIGLASGYVAGRVHLDEIIRDRIHANQLKFAQLNAATIADALEKRKLAVKVTEAPAANG